MLIVATQHDSVYAFDADDNACAIYWHVNLLDTLHGGTPNEIPVVWNDVGYCWGDIYPEVGDTGTPVIDPDTNTIYLVSASETVGAKTGVCATSNGSFYHRLHARTWLPEVKIQRPCHHRSIGAGYWLGCGGWHDYLQVAVSPQPVCTYAGRRNGVRSICGA